MGPREHDFFPSCTPTSDRPLSDRERDLLFRLLLAAPFAGRDELVLQARAATARMIDANGSISLACSPAPKAPVTSRIPVEGEAHDADGVVIHYLLHVVGGMISELEVYKDDSSPVVRQAAPEEVKVLTRR